MARYMPYKLYTILLFETLFWYSFWCFYTPGLNSIFKICKFTFVPGNCFSFNVSRFGGSLCSDILKFPLFLTKLSSFFWMLDSRKYFSYQKAIKVIKDLKIDCSVVLKMICIVFTFFEIPTTRMIELKSFKVEKTTWIETVLI